MFLLALALAPGFAIMLYIYSKDKYDREPLRYLLVSFLLGIVSTIPAMLLESAASAALNSYSPFHSVTYYIFLAFAGVALVEECCKFWMLRWYAYRKKEFDEPFDGI